MIVSRPCCMMLLWIYYKEDPVTATNYLLKVNADKFFSDIPSANKVLSNSSNSKKDLEIIIFQSLIVTIL